MARRKHHRRRYSRRRISGVGAKGVLMKIAGVGVGIFAGRMITSKLGATVNPKIASAIPVIAGIFVPKYLRSDLGAGIGDGLIAAGVLGELQAFNVLSGIGAVPPPGAYANLNTAAGNNYDARTAKAVGDGRPIMRSTVGMMNGIPTGELMTIGALMEE